MGKRNSITFTPAQIAALPCAAYNRHLLEQPSKVSAPKRSKYGAKKTEVNGIMFDSIKEANRYKELLLLLKAGHIGLLQLQVPFELNQGGTHSLKYIADFVYMDAATGQRVVEDAKGYRTKEYKNKKRLMAKIHNIKIKET